MAKLNFQHQYFSGSHNHSEITLICWWCSRKSSIVNVENSL